MNRGREIDRYEGSWGRREREAERERERLGERREGGKREEEMM